MIRQQKRKKLRELEKEYKRIINNKQFQKVLHSKDFEKLCKEELDLLKSHHHSNAQLQAQFDFGCVLLARIKEIEKQISELKESPVYKENVLSVQ